MSDSPAASETIATHDTITTAQRQFRRRPIAYSYSPGPADQKFTAFLISIAGAAKSDNVLEVACGAGATTMAFAERCASATGLDVVAQPLIRARATASERGIGNARFAVGEVERIPFADGAFSGAVCRFSFHHFVNPERVFASMARVVAPGGWMVIADMAASEDPAQAAFHNRLERLCDPTHSRTLPISEFERMFAEHGFRLAMKVDRDARLTVDDWIRFGGAPAENIVELRALVESAIDDDNPGLRFMRDGNQIRMIHTSMSYVIEKEE
jgi:ubiquinone/menaquinone biosynthesis C-methylase UbiE